MNLFFIAWGEYGGFNASIRCAAARVNCPIYVIADKQPGELPANVRFMDIGKFEAAKNLLDRLYSTDLAKLSRATSLARWFVLRDAVDSLGLQYPAFCADWDMMMFSDLNEACKPFLKCDFARTVNHPNEGDTNAAYLVCARQPLVEFCWIVENSTRDLNDPEFHDMTIWREVADPKRWWIGDLTDVISGSTFDLGIHCSLGQYKMDGKSKLVTFRDGHPYFTEEGTGHQILAHNLHCWGEYKCREPELLKKAGIE